MQVKALAFQVIIACIFGACTWDSYSETLLLRLFHSFNSSSGSQVGAQVISIKSCSEKLIFLLFWGMG